MGLVIQLLTTHTAAAHPGGGFAATGSHIANLEKLPRPTGVRLRGTSGMQWEAYIGQGNVNESKKFYLLQSACNPELLQSPTPPTPSCWRG